MQTGGNKARQAEDLQQPGRLRDLRGDLCLGRVDHRAAQQEVHQLYGNGIHHDRAQNFIDTEVCFQKTRNSSPDRPA